MRSTAKYTIVTGFTTASVVTYILLRFGTAFTTMTAVLYLYGIVCLLGGVIGYRRAFLQHACDMADPSMKHILGLHRLRELFEGTTWLVELEDGNIEATSVEVRENLVSVERRSDGGTVGVSYPRHAVVAVREKD